MKIKKKVGSKEETGFENKKLHETNVTWVNCTSIKKKKNKLNAWILRLHSLYLADSWREGAVIACLA